MRVRRSNNGCYNGGSSAKRRPGKGVGGNGDKRGACRGIALPSLLLPITQRPMLESLPSEFSVATQELRLTMMQRAGVVAQLCDATDGVPNLESISSLDTFLETRTATPGADSWKLSLELGALHAEDVILKKGEIFPHEIPWYSPPLKVATLQQRCCHLDDPNLFSSFNVAEFSAASICTGDSFLDVDEKVPPPPPKQQQQQQQQKKKKKNKNDTCREAKAPFYLDEHAIPYSTYATAALGGYYVYDNHKAMQLRRFYNGINQWCDVVMSLDGKQACHLNPTELHEEKMAGIYKEEAELLSALELQRLQEIQEGEHRRRVRQREERQQGGLNTVQKRKLSEDRWRSLLCAWTEEHVSENATKDDKGRGGERVIPPPMALPSGVFAARRIPPSNALHRP